ncbi:BTNL8 isoform 5 [Pongo abelii]|uniref:BTNL8 isoform 5 n=1 Tax=Pongo abelii TaxID=9601 RepID=A0A2J8SCJ4_PONAB|nr:BTNL8 isoform 5 [Pongo abelii]
MAFMLILVLSFYKLASGQWQVTGPGKFVQASVGEDAVFSCSLFPETSAEAMEVRFFRNQLHAVVHLYRDGEDWESKQMPQYRGRTELVKDSIAGGHVSLRLKNITPSDIGLYGCWFSSQIYDEEATWELRVAGHLEKKARPGRIERRPETCSGGDSGSRDSSPAALCF